MRLRSVVAVATLGVSLMGGVRPAAADAVPGACPTAAGVTVVVDFHELGGPAGDAVVVGCATGAVTSGFDALTKAGFDVTAAALSKGFLCRIDGEPSDDPCIDPSPASAYWSYWTAMPGGSWTYSTVGGLARTPTPGSVEGWSFAEDKAAGAVPPPRIAPPSPAPPTTVPAVPSGGPSAPAAVPTTRPSGAVRTPAGSPTATSRPVTTSTTAAGSPAVVGAAGAGGGPPTTSVAPGDAGVGVAATSSTTTMASVGVEAASEARASSRRVAAADGGTGLPVGTVVAIVAIAVLGGGAALTARRRSKAA